MTQPLRQVYAFVALDPDRNVETIVGMRRADHWQPLVTEDANLVEILKPIARRIAHDTHREVKLVRFTDREELPL